VTCLAPFPEPIVSQDLNYVAHASHLIGDEDTHTAAVVDPQRWIAVLWIAVLWVAVLWVAVLWVRSFVGRGFVGRGLVVAVLWVAVLTATLSHEKVAGFSP
jgi:hypothetical protein